MNTNMNDIVMGYIIPGIIALLAAFGVFKVVKSKLSEIKSLKELIDFFLHDELILQILNNIIADMELDVKHYDKLEDFLQEYKTRLIIKFKEYLKSKHIPDSIINLVNDNNIEKIIDIIISKTSIADELNKIFQKSIEAELTDDLNIEEVDESDTENENYESETAAADESENIETESDSKKEETTNIDLNSFYEED